MSVQCNITKHGDHCTSNKYCHNNIYAAKLIQLLLLTCVCVCVCVCMQHILSTLQGA